MTTEEFFAALRIFRGRGVFYYPEASIRVELDGYRYCPVLAVAWRGDRVRDYVRFQNSNFRAIGHELGLNPQQIALITDAADNTSPPNSEPPRELRHKLLQVLGLAPTLKVGAP